MGPPSKTHLRCLPGQRRCVCCTQPFTPQPRLKDRQLTCAKPACRKSRRTATMQAWRSRNPGYNKPRKHPQGFWKHYRNSHPEATARNREQARLRSQLLRKSLQRNLDILQIAEIPEKSAAFSVFATTHRCSILRAFGRDESS